MAHMRDLFGIVTSYQYAVIYAQAEDADHAFAEFDNATSMKAPGLVQLKSYPFLHPIIGDARYTALLKRPSFPTWT